MSRIYIQPSWVDACSDHLNWSGQSPDDRKRKSTDLYLANGRANTGLFAEEAPKAKVKKKVPIASRIIPAQSSLNRVDQQEKELDKAYENGEVDQEEYEELLHCLQSKRERAHKALCKAVGKPLESDPVGYIGVGADRGLEELESWDNSYFLLSVGQGIEKNVKDDLKFFLIGAVVCFSLLYMVFS